MRRLSPLALCALLALPTLPALTACAGRTPYPSVADDGLELSSVVLYRSGVGYFERHGKVEGEVLRLRVRKDQVNDLLKSLTVVDEDGKAVSVSMPLDPQTWASAAMATLAPGRGSLAEVLDSLRGTEITVKAQGRFIRGRIVMIERSINEPDAVTTARTVMPAPTQDSRDWKLTLLSRERMQVVRLSKVDAITLHDGDLAMQLHRSLDASAGEGMFEQVDLELRLAGARSHRLQVSYVVGAPMWKPTYRVVLPEAGKGQALLQGWAVVDNISGEDWDEVRLSLTSGAPIAFRYDLHSPREVYRSDMTQSAADKRATVALGETSWEEEEEAPPPPMAEPAGVVEEKSTRWRDANKDYDDGDDDYAYDYEEDMATGTGSGGGGRSKRSKAKLPARSSASSAASPRQQAVTEELPGGLIDVDTLRRSTMASARSQRISGLTRVDLDTPVTVPDGTSTMVALVNESISAEQTFLYKPGGAGYGYEANPYRVVRFENATDYVLEPGPIAIYSGGSFVGEGLSEAVGAGTSVTIPFAVEPEIMVTSAKQYSGQEMTLTRIVRGVLEVESFYQTTTTWDVRGPVEPEAYKVLIRQPQSGSNYALAKRPEGTEDLEGAWLIPITIPAKSNSASLKVVEQTPSKLTLAIWDQQALGLLEQFLAKGDLDAGARAKLQPIVDLRREIGRIDTEVDGLRRQQAELEQRAEQTRRNLEAIKKDSAAGSLRKKLNTRLEEFSSEADEKGRKIVELESKRLEKKIELEDMLQDLDLRAGKGAVSEDAATGQAKGQAKEK
ncbi:DUF4139 domain-containing protein [Pseudenhygromyxa sp. WMMC2535]|uniref:DUF4139 domain-containing protein n=1 Tax=Pseudenhygromyxa sp. WMMC2535 TaxID=2712867 RepID=UPI00155227EF|nr:DUF4139 domain-containing protein [Pseudenhygromyxa sp. WMMC2535]NVB38386.1 DUF4139 domain-containing protein [Pseudenhygromyxa sp. WMMC2535]